MGMAVTTKTAECGTTIILDRPGSRNAIDPEAAKALRAAFRAFDRDRQARVAVSPRRPARDYRDGIATSCRGCSPERVGDYAG